MNVKICGITRIEDALTAVSAGATMLGYNFYRRSKRYIIPQACKEIQAALLGNGVSVKTVGVFVNARESTIRRICEFCNLDLVQLSGDEPLGLLIALGERAFKGLRPQTYSDALALSTALPARAEPPAFLIDAFQPGGYGGRGEKGDWELARRLAMTQPILFAGGLKADNLAGAIDHVKPWGVDVASGVERAPGVKDHGLMAQFIEIARSSYGALSKAD